jgi:NAD(P)-dependent dehydrogenase (short-subunit alcohol dehydrogenase family)
LTQWSAKEFNIKSYNNKTAFITGGGSGVGLGMAMALAEKGMNLALADINEAKLESAKKSLAQYGVQVHGYTLDVTDKEAVCEVVKRVKETFGSINVVCANAGVSGKMGPLQEAEVADWDWVIDVNLKGVAYVVQACLPYLLENPQDAHIVITSSISGLRVFQPSRGQGMYNTTKFALVGLGEALQVDLAPYGVGVSILCPGVVKTEISHSGQSRPKKYGGAFETSVDHDLASAASSGTDPLQFGRWVVKAIEQNLLHVITHPGDQAQVEERHEKIINSFKNSKY